MSALCPLAVHSLCRAVPCLAVADRLLEHQPKRASSALCPPHVRSVSALCPLCVRFMSALCPLSVRSLGRALPSRTASLSTSQRDAFLKGSTWRPQELPQFLWNPLSSCGNLPVPVEPPQFLWNPLSSCGAPDSSGPPGCRRLAVSPIVHPFAPSFHAFISTHFNPRFRAFHSFLSTHLTSLTSLTSFTHRVHPFIPIRSHPLRGPQNHR